MNAKRNLGVAAGLLVVSAATIWGASRMTWMRALVGDGLSPERPMDVAGHTWAPALTVLPLVLLAAVAAALALKNWARGVVAVVVAVGAIGAAYPAVTVLTQDPDVQYLEKILDLAAKDVVIQADKVVLGPVVAVLGAVVAVVAAALLMRGLRGGGMGSQYSSPAARRAELERRVFDEEQSGESSERDLWDALDSGDDPTEGGRKDRREAQG